MRVLAASGDTWGLSGPTFLVLYGVLLVVVLVAVVLARRRAFRGEDSQVPTVDLQPAEVAYLAEGPNRTVYAALAALRAAGAVGTKKRGVLKVTADLPAGAPEFDRTVYQEISSGRAARTNRLATQRTVAAALTAIRERLEGRGLLTSAAAKTSARLATVGLLAVILFGLARWFAGLGNGKPIGILTVVLLATGALWVLLLVRAPRRTRAGNRALAAIGQQHAHLAPGQGPSWATYGALGAGMGVAVFGTAALLVADPVFASEAMMRSQASGSSGWFGGSDSSSSSSSASSCSGGSSCGGGGGGGGCGG